MPVRELLMACMWEWDSPAWVGGVDLRRRMSRSEWQARYDYFKTKQREMLALAPRVPWIGPTDAEA